jgi:hypothetical protein
MRGLTTGLKSRAPSDARWRLADVPRVALHRLGSARCCQAPRQETFQGDGPEVCDPRAAHGAHEAPRGGVCPADGTQLIQSITVAHLTAALTI